MKHHHVPADPPPKAPCTVCAHQKAKLIEGAMRGGVGLSKIAAQLGLHKPDLRRHKEFCLRGAHQRPPGMKEQIPHATGATPDGRELVMHAPGRVRRADVDPSAYVDLGGGQFMVKRDLYLGTNRSGIHIEVTVAPIVAAQAALIPRAPRPVATARARIWKGP